MKKLILSFLVLCTVMLILPSTASAQTASVICKSTDWMVDSLNGEVRIFHKVGTQYPQYGVIHLNDSYFRLNYGPGSGWGTSIILMPAFWSDGIYYQGAKVNVSCGVIDTLLELTVIGTIDTLTVTEKVKISHPTSTSISADVTASLIGTITIDSRPGEAFKPVALSSMHISSTEWDTQEACVDAQCLSIPKSGWIIPPAQPLTSTTFKLVGGTSDWKTNTPTVVISNLNTASRITGWVTDLIDPNEDNVSLWAAADNLLTSWSYKITAIKGNLPTQPTFIDVSMAHPYWEDIEILYANGLTGGCSTPPLKFCPDRTMSRAEAAVFILRGNFGNSFIPNPATHILKDDWTKGAWAEPWAEAMYYKGLSAGCSSSPLKYCPWDQIPREQAVIFALRLKYGNSYTPPPATGTLFADMTNKSYYATAWAEQAYKDGLIPSCGTSGGKPKICPKALVSRGLAAYMIVRAKNLTMP